MNKVFFTCLVLFSFSLQAELYKWVDENGEIIYSDKPPHEGAKELKLPPITTTPAVKVPPKPKETAEEGTSYKLLRITDPSDQQTIRNNLGNIFIAMTIEPELNAKAGHSISIKVNGQVAVKGLSTSSTSLNNLNRGSHSIQAEIIDKDGKSLISSNSVNVFLHRTSILNQPKQPVAPAPN